MTLEEFEAQFAEYHQARDLRDRQLRSAFIGELLLLIPTVAVVGSAWGRAHFRRPQIALLFAPLFALATFVVATTWSFDRRYKPVCPACGRSAVALEERLGLAHVLGQRTQEVKRLPTDQRAIPGDAGIWVLTPTRSPVKTPPRFGLNYFIEFTCATS